MAARAAARLPPAAAASVERLVLVAPAVVNFPAPPVSQPTTLVHGEADDVVPLAGVLDWARPQTLPVLVVPGVGHFFHGQLALLKQLITGAWPRQTP
jgi:alpha/beta superfamily hydrolase